MSKRTAKPCRACGQPIEGYVDECPHCGADRPVPVPRYYYMIGLAILIAIVIGLGDMTVINWLLGR